MSVPKTTYKRPVSRKNQVPTVKRDQQNSKGKLTHT